MGELLLLFLLLLVIAMPAVGVPSFMSAWIFLLAMLATPLLFNFWRRNKNNNTKKSQPPGLFEWPEFATKSILRSFFQKSAIINHRPLLCEFFINIATIILSLIFFVLFVMTIGLNDPGSGAGMGFIVIWASFPWSLLIAKSTLNDSIGDDSSVILTMGIGVAINIFLYSLGKAYLDSKKTKPPFNNDEDKYCR